MTADHPLPAEHIATPDAVIALLHAYQHLRKRIRADRFRAQRLHTQFLGAQAHSDLEAMVRIASEHSALVRLVSLMTAELHEMLTPYQDDARVKEFLAYLDSGFPISA